MVGANLLEWTFVLALPLGLRGGALPYRTGELSLMQATRLIALSFSLSLVR